MLIFTLHDCLSFNSVQVANGYLDPQKCG